jgi:hypothetical protein
MDSLVSRIDSLPDDDALEAVNLLAGSTFGATPDDEVRADTAQATGTDPTDLQTALERAAPQEAADFARLVLLAHACLGDRDAVERAIDNAGQKAFLLEVAVIGLVGLALVHLALTRGHKEEVRRTRIEVFPDGRVTAEIVDEKRNYSVGESLAPLLEGVLGSLGN